MDRKTLILIALALGVSAGVTRYFFPKVEYRNTEVIKEVVRNDIKTVVRTIERPDGTKETVSETTDRSTKKESHTKETVIAAKNQWMLGGGARFQFSDRETYYDLHVQRRIIGPFFVGATASTDKTVGLSVSMEF